ncbi:MAG: bifunctional nuclease family protein [Aquificaceae bacterium]|nr:bifunctional nuclease family protein [Aquificaceae bacterium]
MVELVVHSVMLDPVSQMPIVVLKVKESEDEFLPIWIGPFEADSIVRHLQSIPSQRPMTYELTRSIIENLGAKLLKVIISDLKDNTYFAELHVEHEGRKLVLDSRPERCHKLSHSPQCPTLCKRARFGKIQNLKDRRPTRRGRRRKGKAQRVARKLKTRGF